MSLAFTTSTPVTGASALTPNVPAGMTAGDLAILYWAVDASSSPSTPSPSGFTLITSQTNGTAMKAAAWTRIWQAGDTAPSVSWTGGGKARCWIERATAADGSTPVPAGAAGNSATSSTMATANAGTASRTGSRLNALYVNTTANTAITTDDRCVIQNDGNTGSTTASTDGRVALMTMERMGQGAPSALSAGNYTATAANAAWCGITFWIQPAVADQFGCMQARYQIVGSAASNALAFGSALTVGSLIIAKITAFGDNNTVVYGGGSVALSLARRTNIGSTERCELWYFENNADTSAATVTATSAGTNDITMCIEEWIGVATSGGPTTTGGFSSSSSSTCNVTSDAATPSGSSLVLSVHNIDVNSGTATLDANCQKRVVKQNTANMAIVCQSREITSGGSTVTVNYTSVSGPAVGALAVFSPAASVTVRPPQPAGRPIMAQQAPPWRKFAA